MYFLYIHYVYILFVIVCGCVLFVYIKCQLFVLLLFKIYVYIFHCLSVYFQLFFSMDDVCCTIFTNEVVSNYTHRTLCTCHHEHLTMTAEEKHIDAKHTTFFLQYLLTTDIYIDPHSLFISNLGRPIYGLAADGD